MSYSPYKYTDVIVEVKGQIGYVRVRNASRKCTFQMLIYYSSTDRKLSTPLEEICM